MEQIRILFLAACPADRPHPQVEEEYKHLEAELDRSPQRDRFDCRFVPAVTRADLLRQLLKLKPEVVHFAGHGTETEELVLLNDKGVSEPVPASEMERVFGLVPATARPKVVIFSACYSASQAEAVTRVINCAIGMSRQILDSSAFAFSTGFYLGLGQGLSIDRAVESGRLAMPGDRGIRELPQLHVRDGVDLKETILFAQGPLSRFPDVLDIDRRVPLDLFARMLSEGTRRLLVVTAEPNMGKSLLLKAMAQSAGDRVVGLIDLAGGATAPETILRRIALARRLTLSAEPDGESLQALAAGGATPPDPQTLAARRRFLENLTSDFCSSLDSAFPNQAAALLIDAFDDRSGDVGEWVENALIPCVLASKRIVCVVAGRVEPQVVTGLHLTDRVRLDNFEQVDVRETLNFLRLDASDGVVDAVWVASKNGQPYLTVRFLEDLWRNRAGVAS